MNNKNLPIYLTAALLVLAAGAGLFYYNYQQKLALQKAQEEQAAISSSDSFASDTPTDPNNLLGLDGSTSEVTETPGNVLGTETGSGTPAGPSMTPGSDTSMQAEVTSAPAEENRNGCIRKFDATKLANDKVDASKLKFVTLDVKGFGKIKIELYAKDAPKSAENFVRLVNAGYYDCLTFHRVSKGFVIQGGDPDGTGAGGISAFGKTFDDELDTSTPSYKTGYVKGVLAMANRGPNTNGSQFFIMIADNPTLPHNYTIFGKVSGSMDAVDKIGAVDITPGQFGPTDGAPKKPVQITKAVLSAK